MENLGCGEKKERDDLFDYRIILFHFTKYLLKKISMKKFIYLLAALVFAACSKTVYVPVETTKYVAVHDTTFLHRTDTLVQVPDVSISDFIDVKDTLVMKSGIVTSKSWVDPELSVLKGRLVQTGKIPVQIVERERVVVKDSVVVKEVPVEVDKPVPYVPLLWKIFSVIGIATVCLLALKIGFKFL